MASPSDPRVTLELDLACRHDVPEIVDLSLDQLPRMTLLHDPQKWRSAYRFGAGLHPRDNFLPVLRNDADGSVAAFAWVDAAMAQDHELLEPWWCINAVAVAPQFQRRGLGADLAKLIRTRAAAVGVVSVYGICYPESAGFWAEQGFNVSAPGGSLVADRQATHRTRGLVSLAPFDDEEGDHVFVWSTPREERDTAARLLLGPVL